MNVHYIHAEKQGKKKTEEYILIHFLWSPHVQSNQRTHTLVLDTERDREIKQLVQAHLAL